MDQLVPSPPIGQGPAENGLPSAHPADGRMLNVSWKLCMANPICFRLLEQDMRLAASRTFWTAGNSRPTRTAMIAITTNSSINVNPVMCLGFVPCLRIRFMMTPLRENRCWKPGRPNGIPPCLYRLSSQLARKKPGSAREVPARSAVTGKMVFERDFNAHQIGTDRRTGGRHLVAP